MRTIPNIPRVETKILLDKEFGDRLAILWLEAFGKVERRRGFKERNFSGKHGKYFEHTATIDTAKTVSHKV